MDDKLSMIIARQSGGVMDFVDLLAAHIGANVRVHRFDNAMRVDGESVLLHYSGYGYAKYGAPVQLLAWLRRNRPRMKRFGIFFHETYASSRSPASSVFWLSPLQRFVARQLARHCDFWVSNIGVSTEWLAQQAGSVPHRCLPVFSNVGEAAALPSPKRNIAIVFGSGGLRADTWRVAGESLFRWADANGVEVHDIGTPIQDADVAALLERHRVVQQGRLEAEAVSALMASARYGVLSYPPHCVAKSSVFAAYCAHGAVPILLTDNTGDYDGLQAGSQYFRNFPAQAPAPEALKTMSHAAFDWYRQHRIAVHAQTIGALLRGEPSQNDARTASEVLS